MKRTNTLNDQIDAGVVTAKSIGGDASKQGRIGSLNHFDTQVEYNSSRQDFFTNGVPNKVHSYTFVYIDRQSHKI